MILETADIPVNKTSSAGRPKAPNPFIDDADTFAALKAMPIDAAQGTKGAAKRVEVPGLLDKTNKEFTLAQRQIRDAGYAMEPKRTFRQVTEQVVGADKKPSVRITFYAITFIERETKAAKAAREALEAAALAQAEGDQTVTAEEFEKAMDIVEKSVTTETPAPVVASGRKRTTK